MPAPAVASVDVTIVRDRFNFDWTTSEPLDGTDTYWWWARSIRVDPMEIIADDGEGNLWSVPFSTDGADAVTFGEPVRVRETFVPVAAAEGAAATAVVQRRRQRVIAATLEQPTKPDRSTNPAAAAATTQEETTTMDVDTTLLARRLGLPEDATDEQITEALATDPQPTIPVAEHEQQLAAAREEARASAAASADDDGRTVRMDRAQVEQLQADAAAGAEARRRQVTADRDALVAAAVQDGRIAPASRQAWREALDARPDAEAAALAALTPGRIPVTERGTTASSEDAADAPTTTGWFSSLQEA